jgi:dUTP pyrophosphatase
LSDLQIQIKRLPHAEGLPLPVKMSAAASGYDLHAAIEQDVILQPGERQLIPTGYAISMPEELEAQIRPRSGLAYKYGITTLNSPGTIDADYRGEIKVLLINHGHESFRIERGERIAQMIFQLVPTVELVETEELTETVRGSGGFGHTGTK